VFPLQSRPAASLFPPTAECSQVYQHYTTSLLLNAHHSSNQLANDYMFTTAFFDIGRGSWADYQRSNDEYLLRLPRLLQQNLPLVLYVDERMLDKVLPMVLHKRKNTDLYTHVISINQQWLTCNTLPFRNLDMTTAVLRSEYFLQLVQDHADTPESNTPLYIAINHAKVDLVMFTHQVVLNATNQQRSWLGWIDFGFFHCEHCMPTPGKTLDVSKLQPDAWTCSIMRPFVDLAAYDPVSNIRQATVYIAGAMWLAPQPLIQHFQHAYHHAMTYFHSLGIDDDDQGIYQWMYFNNFSNMSLPITGSKGLLRWYTDEGCEKNTDECYLRTEDGRDKQEHIKPDDG